MADALTTTQDIDPGLEVYYERTLLETAYPKYVYGKFAEQYNIPGKSGRTIKMRRYSRLSAATTPITEGVTPNGSKLAKVDILATISQYGDFVSITDVVDLTVEDAVLTKTTELQSDQMYNTEDVLCRDVISASASSITCSNGSGTATLLNDTDIATVVQTLLGGFADWITDMIPASTGQGTSPIRPSFVGIFDYALQDDLENVASFKSVSNYGASRSILENEWGNTNNVRWVMTMQGYVSSSTYYCPIIGKNAYGKVKLDGGNAKSIIKGFGSGNDPLNQRSTVGWKMWDVCRILNDAFIIVLKCTNKS
jgi:N4-gp56 family major capsid protein